jgi:hypothetical protein
MANDIRANIIIDGDTSQAVSELNALAREIARTANLVGGSGQNIPIITADLDSIQEAVRLAREASQVEGLELARLRRSQTESFATKGPDAAEGEIFNEAITAQTLRAKEASIAYGVLNEALLEHQNALKTQAVAERRLVDERERAAQEVVETARRATPEGVKAGTPFQADVKTREILKNQIEKLAAEEFNLSGAYANHIAEINTYEERLRSLSVEFEQGSIDQSKYSAEVEATQTQLDKARASFNIISKTLSDVKTGASQASTALNGLSRTPAEIVRTQNENLRENYAVTRSLDRGFNTVSEGFGSVGALLGNFGPHGEFAYIISDMTQLAGSIPEVTGGLSLLRANIGAFIAQLGVAKLAGIAGFAVVIGGIIHVIGQFLSSVDAEAAKLKENAEGYSRSQQFIADSLIGTALTAEEAGNLLRKEDIGQQFRATALAVLKGVRDGTIELDKVTSGIDEGLIRVADALGRNGGLQEVIDELEAQSNESSLAVANLNTAIAQGIPTLNSFREILGDFERTTVELDAATANIENIRQLIAEGDSDIESVSSAIDRYNQIITDSSQAVDQALEDITSATASFQADIAAMRQAVEDTRSANLAQHEFDTFWENIDVSIQHTADAARELLRASREQAALQQKITDIDNKAIEDIDKVVKDTIAKIAKLDQDAADAQLKFTQDEAKIQQRGNIDALRRLRDFERERYEIERDFADKRFDAVLDNDVRSFLEANREEQKALDDLAFKFNTGEGDIKVDADLERLERQTALNEKLAAIEEEKRAALAAQKERIDQITAEAQRAAAQIFDEFHKKQEEARQDAAITDAMDAAFAAAKVARTIATTIRTTALEAAALALQENERKKAHDEELTRLGAVYREQNELRLAAEESLSAVQSLAIDLRTEIDLLEGSALDANSSTLALADSLAVLDAEITKAGSNLARIILGSSDGDFNAAKELFDQLKREREALTGGINTTSSTDPRLPVPPPPPAYTPPATIMPLRDAASLEGRNSVPASVIYHAPPMTINIGEHATKTEAEEIALSLVDRMREEIIGVIEDAIYGAS